MYKKHNCIRSGWDPGGKGACCVSKKDFNASGGWPEYYTWGREDPDFYDYFVKNGLHSMQLIWVNILKLNIMKTLQVEIKKLTFLKMIRGVI
mgnify:CR=1 FL=1